jgi:hypothetical protein
MSKDFNVYKWRRDNLVENEMPSSLEDWKQLWDRHDKWYQMSDSSGVYARGQQQADELHKILMTLSPEDQEEAKKIMTDYYKR